MWQIVGTFILRNRFWLLIVLGLLTIGAGYEASKVQLSYDFAKTVPADDPDFVEYIKFKQTFGEDGSVLVVGVKSDKLFEKEFFNDWIQLTRQVKGIDGVENILSLGNLFTLQKNDSLHTISLQPLVKGPLHTQEAVDSIKQLIAELPFYKGLLYNPEANVTLLAITLNKQKLDSKERIALVREIEKVCTTFGEDHQTEMHFSGLPYVRTVYSSKVADEILIFTYLSIFITALFIFIFFRFFSAVVFSLVVVIISVLFTSASIHLFGYKVTLLTGILPPLMVIIGIQNCIYLLNVYHQEFRTHGNKMLAIIRLISKNGLPLFLTNVTTAVGFCVFSFSGSAVLDQFSIISGINIMLVYVVSLVFIPIVYSYLPPPKYKHTKHLDSTGLNKAMKWCNKLVYSYRTQIYLVTILICSVSVWGAFKVQNLGYVVDDLPHHDKVYTDLKFFEENLKGVLPYEIRIDTKKDGGIKDYVTLQKISKLQRALTDYPEFSKSVSIADLLKYANQAYHDGETRYYIVPNVLEISDILSYLPDGKSGQQNMIKSMVDSNFRQARISIQMADIGSQAMKPLNEKVQKEVDEIFPKDKYDVKLTGTSIIFLKGNDYLVENLLQSMISALVLISLMMAFLFFSWKMVLISLIPNIVPLLMTIGIMGFFDIRLKPSTIIIFSIAYGIVVDFTIHFLAKYRNALKRNNWDMSIAIPQSLTEAGPSIIYTAIALFFGFIIFAASNFGGTVALGVLTSLSLIFGMLMNLLLLPSLLLSLEKSINNKEEFGKTLVELEPEPTDAD
ncbi:MAG: MMPL family transporter [Bacteroidota bacterium]